jgi:hypothetical protein
MCLFGSAREAEARGLKPTHDYTIAIAGRVVGFQDYQWASCSLEELSRNYVQLGPLGQYEVPFSATQGLVGSGVISAMLIALPTVYGRRKQSAS